MNIEQGLCICTLGQKKVALFYDYNNTYLLFIYIWPRNRTVAKTPFNSKVQFGRMLFIRCMERNFPKLIFLVITTYLKYKITLVKTVINQVLRVQVIYHQVEVCNRVIYYTGDQN